MGLGSLMGGGSDSSLTFIVLGVIAAWFVLQFVFTLINEASIAHPYAFKVVVACLPLVALFAFLIFS